MASRRNVFEIDALLRIEQVYRQRLLDDPADVAARTGLAWCLFMQALHRAGQEQMLASLMEAGAELDRQAEAEARAALDQNARDLLRDCLKQTVAVMQLSADPANQSEVERLQELVRLTGEEEALSDAQDEAARILGEITHALLQERQRPRGRRVRPRPRNP
jgi:hypothetical protein